MKIICSMIGAASLLLISCGAAFGEWPERGLTMVTSSPRTVTWSVEEPDVRAEILRSLVPRLSRELGVPVTLVFRPAGSGVLAGNMVAGAKPDGYVFGALGGDVAMGRVIQEFTPYNWAEFVPVSTAWRTLYAVVARADESAGNLLDVPGKAPSDKLRLAHTGLSPIDTPTLLAVRAAQAAGFSWDLKKVDSLNPDYLLKGEVDAMVVPLGSLRHYPEKDKLKVLTVFTYSTVSPCSAGLPTLATQDLKIDLNPPFAFYLPSKVNWRIRSRLSLAINNALQQPNVTKAMKNACLEPFLEDTDGVSAVLNREYKQQESVLKSVNIQEKM
ncbi:hypothetical protein C4J81_02465 [Deltaproteobacteria bacterium Smac51]|nr:hypothetical protein C4J81_02465 [Deltaproteobacteria bacterium Smac51]